ncbi:MAG: TonB-dependent receptor [Bacteroidota bacterium]
MYVVKKLFFLALLCLPLSVLSQSFTISGYVRIAESGETLIGATVAAPALQKGTYTNEYGFYSLTLPSSSEAVQLVFAFSGYNREVREFILRKDTTLNMNLAYKQLEEVEIIAESYQEQLKSTEMSIERVSMKEAKLLPALLGEVDIIKTLQLKPGVSAGSEGSSGIFVRGGGADQNLVLLDGTVLYNPSHLFGFFSTFNTDAVKDVKLFKGGFPAQYGGRLSSVIDVRLNEGNVKKFSGSGGLGLISSRLTLEGPLVKDKGSFMISGRRTYVDIFTRAINRAQEDQPDFNPIPDYFFYDLNTKANYKLGENDQIFLSGYFGRDAFNFDDGNFDFNFSWGNANGTLRWNHLFSPRLFMNVSASVADYKYVIRNEFDIFNFQLGSRITDINLSTDFTWQPNNQHTVRFGASAMRHEFIVNSLDAGAEDSSFNFNAGTTYLGTEMGAYIADEYDVNNKLRLNYGLRLSGFTHEDGSFYANLEPRFALRYAASPKLSIKASYARMVQYLHLVSNSGNTLPTDVWYPSNERVRPEGSHQIAAGFSLQLGEQFLLTNEVYYKWLQNTVDFRNAANLFVNNDLDSEFVFGRGWAYGNEFYLEKKLGRLTGWIGYTLSWSWRVFDGINANGEFVVEDALNDGKRFHPRQDRRHDLSIVSIYEINKRFSVSASWVYQTGNAVTLPIGRFFLFGEDVVGVPTNVPDFPERNSFRMPAYHKLDLGFIIRFFPKWGESDLTISAYNAYNRRNPYFIFFDQVDNANGIPTQFQARQVSLFPIIPSITYNFKF